MQLFRGNGHQQPQQPGVPILHTVKQQEWHCPRGHVFRGDPPMMALPLNPLNPNVQQQYVSVKGVCLFCVLDYLHATFPVYSPDELPAAPESPEETPDHG